MSSTEIPASFGVHGPGEITILLMFKSLISSMEIINELEPSSRGIYGGAIGYISWSGNIDTAIAIRTAIIKDKVMHVGAGAGIVADSIPENEWHECKHKSKVFVDAIKMIP